MTPGRDAATPRRLLLAAVAVVLGVGAHAGAGGAVVVTPTTLLAALLVGAASSAWVTARPLSPGRTLAVLGGGQLVLHLALSGGVGHRHAMTGMDAMAAADPTGAGTMTAAHVVVTVLLATLVAGADRALLRAATALRSSAGSMARDLVRLLTTGAPPPVALGDPRPLRSDSPVHDPAGVRLARAHSRRGPPSVPLVPPSPGGRPAGPDLATERTP